MAEKIENAVIDTFASYNTRRYSLPWVCKMDEHGKYNFNEKIGTYSATHGEEGELVVFHPENRRGLMATARRTTAENPISVLQSGTGQNSSTVTNWELSKESANDQFKKDP